MDLETIRKDLNHINQHIQIDLQSSQFDETKLLFIRTLLFNMGDIINCYMLNKKD
jgi:hypothetical protein